MAEERERGLFVGRFQPLHEGHRRVIETLSGEVDELLVGVGSAGRSHSVDDPYTGGERVEMVLRTVEATDVAAPVHPIPLRDVDRNAVWVSHVRSLCPEFSVVYSHNPLVVRLFREAGVPVGAFPTYDRERLEGTRIRRRMLDGEPWRDLVPDPVVDVVEAVDGVERLRRVDRDDAADVDVDRVPGTPDAGDEG
ncbi:nicotinamide-nucleotide adenylyltransferase [Halobacteriales archaeon SW_12_71_31]|nr:MAG: nicotinamide-nucleotide adenylyltransferase [Halobacteriales archaeon SW_12_71_31]